METTRLFVISRTYLLLEDPIGAENSYLKVLRSNPEFVTDPQRDPIDLVYLSKEFTATPIFAFYAMLGPDTSPMRVIHDVTIGGEPQTQQSYNLRMGWQIGGGIDYNYDDNITFSAGFNYVYRISACDYWSFWTQQRHCRIFGSANVGRCPPDSKV